MGKERVTIRDIAEAAGVSVATVSRVLNRHAYVSPEVADAVRRVIDETGYHPSRLAQSFARGLSRTVTLIYDSVSSSESESGMWSMFALVLAMGLNDVLSGTDYHLRIMNTPGFLHSADKNQLEEWLINDSGLTKGDPVVITNPRISDTFLEFMTQNSFPCVLVGKYNSATQIPQIDVDNVEGMRMITSYLIDLGHTDIAFLAPDLLHTVVEERHLGFMEAVRQSVPQRISARHFITDNDAFAFSYESARNTVSRMIEQGTLPTAIVCFNDEMAFGAMQALVAKEIRVPEDVSVTGFDDLPPARMYCPPLTTIRQDVRKLGQNAGRILLRQVKGQTVSALTLFSVSLVERSSTGPPRR